MLRYNTFIMNELMAAWTTVHYLVRKEPGYKKPWVIFKDNIWSFCLAAGCPKADSRDPFKSIEMLRDLVSRQSVYTVDLQQDIGTEQADFPEKL